ncbi:MAG: argininosuccinate lyase [Culturomica sp.]|jgi:argininosuccinate lyase|nr:argininosuccinate lyase [Culturomica sp.]
MKLWDKGYDTDKFVEEFTVGKDRELDLMLAKWDVIGNIAHLKMLNSIGMLSKQEADALETALKEIYASINNNNFSLDEGIEDIHSQVEYLLTLKCGETGKKIHTGRSRNDQVLTDLKLFARSEIYRISILVEQLFNLLLNKAEDNKDVIMPGYTHLQVAMPSSFGLWFSAYAESLADDMLQLHAAHLLVNTNTLGSGAGYGSSLPLNRLLTTELLAFDDLAYNSVYAQMQRGKMEKNVLFALATVASTIGKMAADICLYASANFDFLKLPDRYTTGSSIMPHKKNPDIYELIRAKCNRLQALPAEISMIVTNLTSGYFRDMQLTKEIFLPAFKELSDCLSMMIVSLPEIEINKNILQNPIYKYLFTVEDVNEMVSAGMPFREAYKVVGMKVQRSEYNSTTDRKLNHTHEGSIGNLCLDEIRAKFARHKWDFSKIQEAEKKLLES